MTSLYGPEFGKFFPLIVMALREVGGSGNTSNVFARSIELLGLTESERDAEFAKGVVVVRLHQTFAIGCLSQGGIVDTSIPGVACLTELGSSLNLDTFNWHVFYMSVKKSFSDESQRRKDQQNDTGNEADKVHTKTGSYAAQALAILRELPASGFEKLCHSLLRRCGFRQVTVTSRPGDGDINGIGILQINAFVSFSVLFQCKQCEGSVKPAQIRDLRSAMVGRADKGFVMTTGTFTVEANKEARRVGAPPIELVDGESLVRLFESLEFGLVERKTYDVDTALFHQFQE